MPTTFEQNPDYVRGAGEYEAKLTEQGIPETSWGSYGDNMNPNEYQSIVTGFESTGDPYSADNVQMASEVPVQAPDFSDPLGIRDRINTDLGLPELESELTDVKDRLTGFDQDTRAQGLQIEGRAVSMSKITGIKDQALRQRVLGRVEIVEELEAKADLYAAQRQESQFRFGIQMDQIGDLQSLMLQAPGAGITLTDDYQSAVGKMQDWNVEQEKVAREQAKDDAFDQMYMSMFGSTRGKLSRREAEKAMKKRAGSDKAFEDQMKELELASARKALAKPYYAPSSSSKSDEFKLQKSYSETEQKRMINEALDAERNWEEIAETFDKMGIDTNSDSYMDTYLKGQFGFNS